MPWTEQDVEKYNKGLSDHQKKVWVAVANSVLSKTGDDGSAIKQANGVVKEAEDLSPADDASDFANQASDLADRTNKFRDHNRADKLHTKAGNLHFHTGNEEQALKHYQASQSHALTARHCNEGLEAVLYAKAADMIEAVRLQETANFWGEIKVALHESDPFPRIERDIKGKAVVPSAEQFRQYFETMAVSHIKDRLNAARGRWTAAAEGKKGPELSAIKNEVSAATAVLRAKHASEQKVKKIADKKQLARYKAIHTSIKKVAGKNPFMYMMMKHLANHYIGELPGKKKR